MHHFQKRITYMTTLASLLSQFGTQLATYQGDQTAVAADAAQVAADEAKQQADTTQEGVDLTTLQATWDQCKTAAGALGLT
jgi:hypothetical protein